jgi:hypothetical protein
LNRLASLGNHALRQHRFDMKKQVTLGVRIGLDESEAPFIESAS